MYPGCLAYWLEPTGSVVKRQAASAEEQRSYFQEAALFPAEVFPPLMMNLSFNSPRFYWSTLGLKRNFWTNIFIVFNKVVNKFLCERSSFQLILFPVLPGKLRIQNLIGTPGTASGIATLKLVDVSLDVIQISLQSRANHCPGERKFDSFTYAKTATRPASVQQPDLSTVFLQFFS